MNGLFKHAIRLVGVPCILLAGVRCAHVEAPSGGPVDTIRPAVAAVYPAPGATGVPSDARTIFQFSEWIDRGATRGTVMISPPYAGRVRVEVDGDRLIVRPPAGQTLRPSTTHTITLLGSLKDLRGNAMGRRFDLRFSTGAALDTAGLEGTLHIAAPRGALVAALYRLTDRPGSVTPLSPRDTAFAASSHPEPWRELPIALAIADSTGAFRFDGVPDGEYTLFAFEDLNGNFAFDVGLESGAAGDSLIALRPQGESRSLRLAPLDTLPLRVATITFVPEPLFADSASAAADTTNPEFVEGTIRITYSRAAQPARAAEPGRYLIVPDSGEARPVTGAAWSPEDEAWVLQAPPLRVGVRHRLALRARPDFPGRFGADEPDTSAGFVPVTAEPGVTEESTTWTLTPLTAPGGPGGLPRQATFLQPEKRHVVASSKTLTPQRWRTLETRLETVVRGKADDTIQSVLRHRLERLSPITFLIEFETPINRGKNLDVRLRPLQGDSVSPIVLYSGIVPDSTQAGRLKIPAPSDRPTWTFWAQPAVRTTAASTTFYPLRRITGDSLESALLPPGPYRVAGFLDRDGDGVWNTGSIRPWIAQEPYEEMADTVRVGK